MNSFDHDAERDEVDPKHLSPLAVDPTTLHALIDQLTVALHDYIDVAVGIRAEFDATTAEDDPRIDAVEDRVGEINGQIAERFESDLGFVSAHTNEMWSDRDSGSDDDADLGIAEMSEGSLFEMGFLVVPTTPASSIESAFALVESGGERIARELASVGFDVQEWGASRSYIETDLDDSDDADDSDSESGETNRD